MRAPCAEGPFDDVRAIVERYAIDLIVPCFEEAFFLAHAAPALERIVPVFASPFPLLETLHNKHTFNALARELGMPVPATTVVRTVESLVAAAQAHGKFFARPVWSRGGLDVYTNVGRARSVAAPGRCSSPTVRPGRAAATGPTPSPRAARRSDRSPTISRRAT